MALVLAFGDIVQCSVVCTANDQVSITSHHYRVRTAAPTATLDDAAAAVNAAVYAPMKALLANTARFEGVMAVVLNRLPFGRRGTNTDHAGVGTAGAIGLPRQCAGLITWRTSYGGPSQRGRSYMPFPAAADDDGNGQPSAGYLTKLGTYGNAVFAVTDFNAGGRLAFVDFVLLHRNADPTLDTYDFITQVDVGAGWATQRRRGSYGRQNVSPL